MLAEFEIYWKRSVVFWSSLKSPTASLGGVEGEGRSLFPLLWVNSLQAPHFSTDALAAQFNRDSGEKAFSLLTA